MSVESAELMFARLVTESLRACSINENETGLKGSSDPVNKLSPSKLLQQRLKTAQLTSSLTQAEKINVKKKEEENQFHE